jgi:hypothetical protein
MTRRAALQWLVLVLLLACTMMFLLSVQGLGADHSCAGKTITPADQPFLRCGLPTILGG